jgi:chemotaxis protein histidine kinase CheA
VATKLEERVSKHDREIAAIRKLILTGMKMLNQLAGENVETRKQLRELAVEQRETARQLRETDRQLQAFIRSLRRGTNGHQQN